jgi:hypothetical protein
MRRAIARAMDTSARRGRKLNPARPPRKVKREISQLAESFASATGAQDATELAQGVMMMAYAGAEAELQEMAARVKANLEGKKTVREDLAELRDLINDDQWPAEFTYTEHVKNASGKLVSTEKTVTLASKDEAEALLQDLESQLQTMTDMSQMLQLQLQEAMNKQQQAMQILSNIMKNQHDTLKAIIQNMR